MRLNLRLVKASQFLQQFKLNVWHPPGKEYIIPDTQRRLASTNVGCADLFYSELDALFTYNTILVEIHLSLISKILVGYEDDKYWARLHCQVQTNENLDDDRALLPFVSSCSYRSDSDLSMSPRLKDLDNSLLGTVSPHLEGPIGLSLRPSKPIPRLESSPLVIEGFRPLPPNETKLLYHVNRTISNLQLCIPPAVAPDILQIAHEENHPGFSHCYKIVTHSWYIRGLTKLLREFIQHYSQCVQLWTRRHRPYESLQPIEFLPVFFFTLTLDFVLTFLLTKQGFNAIMSVTYKFSKRVTLIESVDT